MLWKEKERSRVRAVQLDNLRGLLGIRRIDSPKCMDKGVLRSEEGSRLKGLMKVSYGGSAMWKGWRGI